MTHWDINFINFHLKKYSLFFEGGIQTNATRKCCIKQAEAAWGRGLYPFSCRNACAGQLVTAGWFDSGSSFAPATREGRERDAAQLFALSSPDTGYQTISETGLPAMDSESPGTPEDRHRSCSRSPTQSFCPLAGFLFSTALSPCPVQPPDAQSLCTDHHIQCP